LFITAYFEKFFDRNLKLLVLSLFVTVLNFYVQVML